MQLPTSLKNYLKLAIERRQILARKTTARIAVAMIAAIVLLVGLALVDVSVFLALRPLLGDLGAVLLIAIAHILVGALLGVLALREPASAELTALTEAEANALRLVSEDASDTVAAIEAAQRRIERNVENLLPENLPRQLMGFQVEFMRRLFRGYLDLSRWSAFTTTLPDKPAPDPGGQPSTLDGHELTALREQVAKMQRQLEKLTRERD